MAIVTVTASDGGDMSGLSQWRIPPGIINDKTPVPRGLRTYAGNASVLALGAGDQTAVSLTLGFPTNFMYLPRDVSIIFRSDDTTLEFEQNGVLRYTSNTAAGSPGKYALRSEGIGREGATLLAELAWRPMGTWRQWINGPDGDTMILHVQDMSGDTSAAGDIFWLAHFWQFDIEQRQDWPVNLYEMQIPYSN